MRFSRSDMTRLRRSGPAITRSMASSHSFIEMLVSPRRAASSAASFRRLARSAPVKPGVRRARSDRSTSSPSGLPFAWTARMASRPTRSGWSTTIWRSKRPGRSSAGSRMSGRFVAAIRMTPALTSKPSISTRSWLSVCSRSSWPPPRPAPRWRPTASISSTKMIAGAVGLGLLEQVAHPAGADADEHLDEVRTRDREERRTRLAGDGAGQQGLAGPRRAEEQDALRDLRAHGLEALGLGQEVLDLRELLDGLVAPGDVGEGDRRAGPCRPCGPWSCRTRPIGPPPPCMLVTSHTKTPTRSTIGRSWKSNWVSSDSAWLSVSTSTPASTSCVVSSSAYSFG